MQSKLAFPDAPPPVNSKSIRLHVNLTEIDVKQPNAKYANIISYRELLRKHIAAQQPPNNNEPTGNISGIKDDSSSPSSSPATLSRGEGVEVGGLASQNHSNGHPLLDSGAEGSDRDESDEGDDDHQPNSHVEGTSSQTMNGHDGKDGALPKKKKPGRPTWDDYDLDDAFIDDSDLFGTEVNYTPPTKWDYGFFVWRGPVESFFDE